MWNLIDDKTALVFILGLTIGSAFIAASYQNKHRLDRGFAIKFLGNLFAHGIVILFGAIALFGIASVVHTLAVWILAK